MEPNIPKNMKSDAVFARLKVRLRKKRIGSIGCSARSSHATNATSSSAPTTNAATISRLPQPWPLPRTSAQTIPSKPVLTSPTPGRSSRVEGPCVSSSWRSASGISTSPIGTFSQKIHCQEMPSTTAPPTSGPSATASPPMPPQAPSARPRRSGRTAAPRRMVSVSGITIAPPSPCTARATLRTSTLGASARRPSRG